MPQADIPHELTLQWEMTGDTWDHWVRGLGHRTPDQVVSDGLRAIQEDAGKRRDIARRAKNIGRPTGPTTTQTSEESPKHTLAVTVPSREWQSAMRDVDGGEQSLRSEQLLAGIIMEDESWSPPRDAEYPLRTVEDEQVLADDVRREQSAGWHDADLVRGMSSLLTRRTPRELSLKTRELRLLKWAVAGAVASGVGTGIHAVVAVWSSMFG